MAPGSDHLSSDDAIHSLRSYDGHTDAVFALAWSPDNHAIASASRDGSIHIWSVANCQPLLVFRAHRTCVLAVAWSPDGAYIASGDTAGQIYVWHAQTGQIHTHYQGHRRFVRSLSWSPDSQYIVSGGDYGDNTIQVWSAHSGHTSYVQRSQYRIFSAPWSPDGQYIAAGSFDGQITLLDAASGQLSMVGRDAGPIYTIAWSPDSTRFVATGELGQASIWHAICIKPDKQSQTISATLAIRFPITPAQGSAQAIKACAWSPDGEHIASGGNDTILRVWSPYSGKVEAALADHHQHWIRAVGWSNTGRLLASASAKKIVLWDWRAHNRDAS